MQKKAAKPYVEYMRAEGLANIQQWHVRLDHLNPQYIKIMADRELVDVMSLSKRMFDDCEVCPPEKYENSHLYKIWSKDLLIKITQFSLTCCFRSIVEAQKHIR